MCIMCVVRCVEWDIYTYCILLRRRIKGKSVHICDMCTLPVICTLADQLINVT